MLLLNNNFKTKKYFITKMFNYRNTISNSFQTINQLYLKNSFKKNLFCLNINNKTKHFPNKNNFNNNVIKFYQKNIFSKIFNNNKKNNIEETIKKGVKLEDLKFQDEDGNLNTDKMKANSGEYNFSYNTETDKTTNYEDSIINDSLNNPEQSLNSTFSKEFLKVDKNFKAESKQKLKYSDRDENNFSRLANLIDYELSHASPSLVNQYESLDFKEDLEKYVNEMHNLGYNNELLRSIFRKKYLTI